jgi:hypothetical protein
MRQILHEYASLHPKGGVKRILFPLEGDYWEGLEVLPTDELAPTGYAAVRQQERTYAQRP